MLKRTMQMTVILGVILASIGGCSNDQQSTVKIILPVDAGIAHASGQGGTSGGATLAIRTADAYVSHLVDLEGRSLYGFTADEEGDSSCYDECALEWPPLITHGKPKAGQPGVDGMLIGTTERTDESEQVTYKGQPLYYFRGDEKPGDVRGHGVESHEGTWYLITPEGDAVDYE